MDELLKDNDYKFSVLMPIYIHEKDDELRTAIDSVINQTLPPDEILIIADKDIPQNTRDILNEYKSKYPEIFNPLVLDRDANLGEARVISIEKAKYNIIANMDSDDISKPDRFEKQMNFMKENQDIDVVGTWIEEFEGNPDNIYAIRKLPLTNEDLYKYCKLRSPINNMTIMAKKMSIIDAGNYATFTGFEDFELWGRMLKKGYKLANIAECLVKARAGKNLVKRRRGIQVFKRELAVYKRFYEYKFVNKFEFMKAISLKLILHIIPNWFREYIYNNYLRKKVG